LLSKIPWLENMKFIQLNILLIATLLSFSVFGININMASPEGLWKTYDDDGEATGYVRINEANGIYSGVIEKSLPTDRDDKYCTECKDERKNQSLIGMTIIKNLRAKGEKFVGGEILDPFSGNTYRVKLKLIEAGKKLEVRGFIGISLFGRTQIWERAENGQ
jgi:uncharacterized protein (DUF2147 family)